MSERGASYLLRFDDLCPTMNWPIWEQVVEVLMRADARPLLAVIPDNRDSSFGYAPPAADFWARIREWQQMGWAIGLHGYQHLYVSDARGICGTDPRSEFAGVSRSEQYRKIHAGIDIFHEHGVEVDVWVAPNHSFDETTVELVAEAGIGVISDGFASMPYRDDHGLVWVPCQLNDIVWRRAGVWTAHYHPNYWTDERVRRFAQDVERISDQLTDLDEILAECGDRPRTWRDEVYSSYRIARSRVRHGSRGMSSDPDNAGRSVASRHAAAGQPSAPA